MYTIIRRLLEALIAAFVLIVASPLILMGIFMVKSDGGPIFFLQERVGRGERIFRVIKLRTMVVNAESMLDARGRSAGNRITRFGGFLRKSSIDELPQLINVINGDMSIIGPRPILPRMLPYLTRRERRRFEVRPGMTGLAQIKGRNYLLWSRRFHYDVIYIERQSFCFDIYIALLTIKVLLFRSGQVAPDTNPDQVDDITIRPLATLKETLL